MCYKQSKIRIESIKFTLFFKWNRKFGNYIESIKFISSFGRGVNNWEFALKAKNLHFFLMRYK